MTSDRKLKASVHRQSGAHLGALRPHMTCVVSVVALNCSPTYHSLLREPAVIYVASTVSAYGKVLNLSCIWFVTGTAGRTSARCAAWWWTSTPSASTEDAFA